jgi:hypothetical protein
MLHYCFKSFLSANKHTLTITIMHGQHCIFKFFEGYIVAVTIKGVKVLHNQDYILYDAI